MTMTSKKKSFTHGNKLIVIIYVGKYARDRFLLL
jgi:hypothetical protein